jgi:ABC-type Fe3+/spermidine/putrescine transport system ATPase subunit
MRDGRIEQVGEPRSLYRKPASRFVADFMGDTNWFRAEVARNSNGRVVLNTDLGAFTATSEAGGPVAGDRVLLGFRPEAVEFGGSDLNSIAATVSDVSYLGEIEQYGLKTAAGATIKALERNPVEVRRAGTPTVVHVRPENLMILGEK